VGAIDDSFLPSEAGEVAPKGRRVMNIITVAHDPTVRFAGTSPLAGSAKGREMNGAS
jgi:hypothetical protein